MPKPTLIIGIGTSGMHILEQVQHFCYENTGRNRPEHVGYLYLETDENSFPGLTAQKNEIRRVHISLRDRETMINNLKDNPELTPFWLPPTDRILDADFGAGGWPAFGRVALWGHQNFDAVRQAIVQLWTEIGGPANLATDDSKPAVFITGTLTGGTGAGIFIDLAYLMRYLIRDISEIYGLFTLPGEKSLQGNEIIYCNTYAALTALDFYTRKGHPSYQMSWPNGHQANFDMAPYALVQFISQDSHGDIPPIATLAGLEKMAGLFLFLNVFGLRGKRISRLGDAKQGQFIDKYGTLGMSAIQYPKSQIEEYLSIELTIQLFNRWIDPRKYYFRNHEENLEGLKTRLYHDIAGDFEKFLKAAIKLFDVSTIREGTPIIYDLEKQAAAINQKDFSEENEARAVYNLFTAEKTGNYYDAALNHVYQVMDAIIQGIYQKITQSVDQFENLSLAKMQLSAFIAAIDDCLEYWKSLNLSGDKGKWELFLKNQIPIILGPRYRILFQQDTILLERLTATFEMMKIHLIIPKLIELRNNINASKFNILTSDGRTELPTIKRIDQIIDLIQVTIGNKENDQSVGQQHKRQSLKYRKAQIENDVQDHSIPVLRILPAGSFEKEVENALFAYKKSLNRLLPSKKIFLYDQSLWDYLSQQIDQLIKNLYADFIPAFQRDLQQTGVIKDYDFRQYVQKHPQEAVKIAKRATFPLVKINPDKKTAFGDAVQIPKLVIGSDRHTVEKVIDSFTEENFLQFSKNDDGVFIHTGLRNVIVFYVEKGLMNDNSNFEPLKHLHNIREIADLYQRFPQRKKLMPREWHIERNPYLKFEDLPVNPKE